jgi:hypothetical protein
MPLVQAGISEAAAAAAAAAAAGKGFMSGLHQLKVRPAVTLSRRLRSARVCQCMFCMR